MLRIDHCGKKLNSNKIWLFVVFSFSSCALFYLKFSHPANVKESLILEPQGADSFIPSSHPSRNVWTHKLLTYHTIRDKSRATFTVCICILRPVFFSCIFVLSFRILASLHCLQRDFINLLFHLLPLTCKRLMRVISVKLLAGQCGHLITQEQSDTGVSNWYHRCIC